MNIWDIVIVAILVLVIAGAVFTIIKRKKKGGCCGSGCTGNCAQCGRNCDCKKEK